MAMAMTREDRNGEHDVSKVRWPPGDRSVIPSLPLAGALSEGTSSEGK